MMVMMMMMTTAAAAARYSITNREPLTMLEAKISVTAACT
jgi:hypothetical protein